MPSDREWMYRTRASNGLFNPEFQHVTYFLDFAYANATNIRRRTIEGVEVLETRCSCIICKNLEYKNRDMVEYDLYDESLDEVVFCTNRSGKAYEEYATAMLEKYGEDVTQHPVGDIELWECTQGRSKFGIGSSDSNFITTGAPASSSGSTPSYVKYQRSQEKVRNLQSQVEELHNRVENVQQQIREEMKEEMQRQISELMKKFGNPGNTT
ncbi:hypothetical protein R6Q57_010695 [Mikania cordata]